MGPTSLPACFGQLAPDGLQSFRQRCGDPAEFFQVGTCVELLAEDLRPALFQQGRRVLCRAGPQSDGHCLGGHGGGEGEPVFLVVPVQIAGRDVAEEADRQQVVVQGRGPVVGLDQSDSGQPTRVSGGSAAPSTKTCTRATPPAG